MSLDALRWAFSVNVSSSAERLVLLALANDCRRAGAIAFPSRERLRDVTRLDPKTITAALKRLERGRLIESTGERKGVTGRIPVYRLKVRNVPASNATESGAIRPDQQSGKSHRIGARGETPPLFPANPTGIPSGNDTKNGAQNQEVKPEPVKPNQKKALFVLPDWVPIEPWKAFVRMRRRIDYPLEARSRKRSLHQLEQLRAQGEDLAVVIQRTVDAGWRGFFPVPTSKRTGKALDVDLAEKDYTLPRELAA